MSATAELPLYLTKQQVADQCSCSTKTIDNLEDAGLIKAMRRKRFVRYHRDEVLALREKLTQAEEQ